MNLMTYKFLAEFIIDFWVSATTEVRLQLLDALFDDVDGLEVLVQATKMGRWLVVGEWLMLVWNIN